MGIARRIGGGIIGLRWKGDARGMGLIGKNGKYEKYEKYGMDGKRCEGSSYFVVLNAPFRVLIKTA